ncbi:hypothetical protein NG774_09620 [Aliarcobacter cryaerophilus]|uniref:hypothetical protein n=1 Tax=Aliarcobacter cryaerophilus TaxID=28198 RepID=UPI003DA309BB
MIDDIFGKLEYKYNFYKYDDINLFGENYRLKIVVENDESNSVLVIQQNNYKIYKRYINENQDKIIEMIKQYFFDVYITNIDIYKEIKPQAIYFSRDGSWGLLFDTEVDSENGFAIFYKDKELHIGTQDMFI